MNVYPIFLEVSGRPCLVIGGGPVGFQKVRSLVQSGADVTVVSPEVVLELDALAESEQIIVRRRPYEETDLDGAFLVYAATGDDQLHAEIAAAARARGVLINVADRPQWCDFIVPSVARRGDLVVAVSTSGASPAMARRVRQDIESMLGPEYESAIEMFSALRRLLAERGWSFERRRQLFDDLLDGDVLGLLRSSDDAAMHRLIEKHTGEPIPLESLGWGS